MKPVPGRQGIDIAGAILCAVALPSGLIRVFTAEHVVEQVSGGLMMLTAGLLGVNAGLRIRARMRARRQSAADDLLKP